MIKVVPVESSYADAKAKYDEYINVHVANVMKVWKGQLRPILEAEGINVQLIDEVISNHDQSKWSEEEYEAYLYYFYLKPRDPDWNMAFDVAWNHHQKSNPHHWQYWLLIKDEGGTEALEMPIEYLAELICDWQAMGYTYGNLASEYYEKNKHKMVFAPNTKAKLETYLPMLDKLI